MRDVLIVVGGIIVAGLLYTFSSAYLSVPGKPGAEIPPPGPISISGMVTCLPHKETRGPQTLECAFGFQDTQGLYYGLRDSDPGYATVGGAPMNTPVRIEGIFTPQTDTRYQSVGIIDVFSIVEDIGPRHSGISGTYACLPFKESGSEEGECLLGARTDDGKYYVLDFGPLSQSMPNPVEGERIEAGGVYIGLEMISNDTWDLYAIDGIFSVSSLSGDGSQSTELQ
jgi:hypothetical protein